MANHHYGEIGDVWKHLPLLAIAGVESPLAYWESHAGSAAYPWRAHEARAYGAERFLALCGEDPILEGSRYAALLREAMAPPPVYPGSPRLMLEALGDDGVFFVFCDIDGGSVTSIQLEAERLGVRSGALDCVVSDGNRELKERAVSLDADTSERVLVMLDPFELEAVGEGGVSALDAMHALAGAGAMVMLWWCAGDPEERDARRMLVERACEGCEAETHMITVGGDEGAREAADRFGVWSCAVTLVNLSEDSRRAVAELGTGLARVYTERATADAPGLRFESRTHAPKKRAAL